MFAESGFDSTTTAAIAHRADIGVGTLFSYVQNKEDLLILVFMDELLAVTERAQRKARLASSLLERVLAFYTGFLKYHFKHLDLSTHLVREVAFVRSPERRTDNERLQIAINSVVSGFIEAEIAARSILLNGEVSTLTENCFSIYYRTLTLSLNRRETYKRTVASLRKHLEMQLQVVARGVGS